jgi:hypothetical protein
MKTLLIALSLTANLLLGAFALRPALAPPAFRDFFHGVHAVSDRPATVAPSAHAAPKGANGPGQLWARLQSDDLPTLVARLRANGFPATLIRAMINAEINARYSSRLRALTDPDPSGPYWKQSNILSTDSPNYAEYTRLQRERAKLLRDLFSDPAFASDDVSAAQRRQFGNLSRQKIDLVQRIEDDYGDMMSAVRATQGGTTLPEDREKFSLLAGEKHADLAAILTPEELADYEVRSSPLVNLLSRYLGGFDASEAEFRGVFQAQQKYGAVIAPAGGLGSGVDPEIRQAAVRQLTTDLQAALGDARYADYQRETNRDFQQLSRIAQQEKISPVNAVQAFNLRENVAAESNRILDDAALDPDQKRAALQTLAQNTRAETLSLLGPAAGQAYLKIQDSWLTTVERGSAVSFNSNNVTSSIGTTANGVNAMVTFTGGATYRRLPPAPPSSGR